MMFTALFLVFVIVSAL